MDWQWLTAILILENTFMNKNCYIIFKLWFTQKWKSKTEKKK